MGRLLRILLTHFCVLKAGATKRESERGGGGGGRERSLYAYTSVCAPQVATCRGPK